MKNNTPKTGYDVLAANLKKKGIKEAKYFSALAKKSWLNRGKNKKVADEK